MIIGYRKESWSSLVSGKNIQHRRDVVVGDIERWILNLRGEGVPYTKQLSRLEGELRYVCLRYGNQEVPLNDHGHTVGVLDPNTDEIMFWEKMMKQVVAGEYDDGINTAADRYGEQLKRGNRAA